MSKYEDVSNSYNLAKPVQSTPKARLLHRHELSQERAKRERFKFLAKGLALIGVGAVLYAAIPNSSARESQKPDTITVQADEWLYDTAERALQGAGVAEPTVVEVNKAVNQLAVENPDLVGNNDVVARGTLLELPEELTPQD